MHHFTVKFRCAYGFIIWGLSGKASSATNTYCSITSVLGKGAEGGSPAMLFSNARCKLVFLKPLPSEILPWHPMFKYRNLNEKTTDLCYHALIQFSLSGAKNLLHLWYESVQWVFEGYSLHCACCIVKVQETFSFKL